MRFTFRLFCVLQVKEHKRNRKSVIASYQAAGVIIADLLRWLKVMERILKPKMPFPLIAGTAFFMPACLSI